MVTATALSVIIRHDTPRCFEVAQYLMAFRQPHSLRAGAIPSQRHGPVCGVFIAAAAVALAVLPPELPAAEPAFDLRFIREDLPGKVQHLYEAENYAEAIDLLERGVAIAAAPGSSEHRTACSMLEVLAKLYDHVGDHDRALEAVLAEFRLVCDLAEVTMEQREAVFRDSESRLARQGDVLRTRTLCDLFLATCRRDAATGTGRQAHVVARALLQAASLCVSVGLADDATRYLDEFDGLLEAAASNADQRDLAGLLFMFGNRANLLRAELAADRGDFQTARRSALRNLELTKGAGGFDDHAIADALVLLAEICRKGRDYDRALGALIEAASLIHGRAEGREGAARLGIIDDIHTDDELFSLKQINMQAAQTLRESGDPATARTFFMKSLEYSRRHVGQNLAAELNILLGLGRCEMAEGDWTEAFDAFDIARRPFHEAMTRAAFSLGSGEQAGLIARINAVLGDAATIAVEAAGDSDQRAAWGAEWLLNFKGIAAAAQVRQQRLARAVGSTVDRESLYRLGVIRQQLSALTTGRLADGAREIAAAAKTLEREESALLRKLAFDGGYAGGWETWHTLDEMRAAVPPDAAFIDILRSSTRGKKAEDAAAERYLAWVIPAAGKGHVTILDLGPADDVDAAVAAYRAAITAAEGGVFKRGQATAEDELKITAAPLAAKALQPIVEAAGDATEIILSPDGSLWLVPWQALPLADGTYAIEKFTIRTVTSGRDLLPVHVDATSGRGGSVVVADPDFGSAAAAGGGAETNRNRPRAPSPGKYPRLPNTRVEAAASKPVLETLTGSEPEILLGADASEANLRQAAVRPRTVVLATHGFFKPDQTADRHGADLLDDTAGRPSAFRDQGGRRLENPLLRCGLALAGANVGANAGGGDDGILTGAEIVGLDLLGTELVVLSACETGVGTVKNGEGVAGLRQAFQIAGATSIVATLWQVPDAESAQIMKSFYASLATGRPPSQALREAQLAFIKARREDRAAGEAAHPYLWAAYGVTGR